MPQLRAGFVWWKLLAATGVAMVLLGAPLARMVVAHPGSLPAFAIGVFLVVAAGTSLGVISETPKTFTVVFLTFWYVVTNDNGASPALDFAGFYGQVDATCRADICGDCGRLPRRGAGRATSRRSLTMRIG